MTTPKRFLLLSLPLVLICISYMLNNYANSKNKLKKIYLMGVIILIVYNHKGILYGVNYSAPHWNRPVRNDYESINYLLKNVDSEFLVLNDPNAIGQYINSFRLQNVVYDRSLLNNKNDENKFYLNRARECIYIIKNPSDYNQSFQILKKYGIKYIIMSSSNKCLDYDLINSVKKTKLKYEKYLNIYDENPNLRLLHETKYTRVYEVIYYTGLL